LQFIYFVSRHWLDLLPIATDYQAFHHKSYAF